MRKRTASEEAPDENVKTRSQSYYPWSLTRTAFSPSACWQTYSAHRPHRVTAPPSFCHPFARRNLGLGEVCAPQPKSRTRSCERADRFISYVPHGRAARALRAFNPPRIPPIPARCGIDAAKPKRFQKASGEPTMTRISYSSPQSFASP